LSRWGHDALSGSTRSDAEHHDLDSTVEDGMADLALLLLRVVTGGLLVGHGAQKLFGSFGGYGLSGTADWLETLGLRPGKLWAGLAGVGELVGGLLTILGLGGSLGSIMTISSMKMATFKVHAGKPIWTTAGGAELPVVNAAVGTALMLTGSGRYSLDRLFGIRVPRWLTALTMLGSTVVLVSGLLMEPELPAEQVAASAGA
jgi:putative oxidoreductase